LTFIHWITYS